MHMLTKIGRFSLQSWLAGETTYAKSFPRAKQGKSGSAQILDQISFLGSAKGNRPEQLFRVRARRLSRIGSFSPEMAAAEEEEDENPRKRANYLREN